MSYLICLLSVLVLIGVFLLLKFFTPVFNDKQRAGWIIRSCAGVLLVVFFIRIFSTSDTLFTSIHGLRLNEDQFDNKATCIFTLIAVWLEMLTVVICLLYPFFRRFSLFRNYAKTIGVISCILNIVLLRWTAYSYTGAYDLDLTTVMMALEVAIVTFMVFYCFVYGEKSYMINKKEAKEMGINLPIVLLFSLPIFFFMVLGGNAGQYNAVEFNFYHRLYLYIVFALVVGLFLLLRKKDKEFVRMMLLFISVSMLFANCYDRDFNSFANWSEWPLGITSLCMLLIVFCLFVPCKWVAYFTLFIGAVGAFTMMFMPTYSAEVGFFYPEAVGFWSKGICVLLVPIMMVMLGVYERPRTKDFFISLGCLLVYMLIMIYLSAFITASAYPNEFGFLNSTFILDEIGLSGMATNHPYTFSQGALTMTVYPLYHLAYFGVYAVFSAITFGIFIWVFHTQDYFSDIERMNHKIRVEEYAMLKNHPGERLGDIMSEESINKLLVKNVYKRYSRSKVLSVENASFEVRGGEILGFLGHNGAGKSSIIKCIVGIQPPSRGSIEINGYDITKQPVEAKMQIGYVPDHYALYEKLTGREYINYVADLYNVTKEDRDERLERLSKNLSMDKAIDAPISTYSHGMKQKTAIMAALIHDPKLWILDEPLTGLDPQSIYEVKECMKDHARRGNIVFFSSHLIDVVEKLCDRIIMIKNGHILLNKSLARIEAENEDLEKFYLDMMDTPIERRIIKDNKEFKHMVSEETDSYFYRLQDKQLRAKDKGYKEELKEEKEEAKAEEKAEK